MILAGDIGGTKCNLALFEARGQQLHQVAGRRYSMREVAARPFESLLRDFQEYIAATNGALSKKKLQAAGFGAAGAVVNGVLHGTYVPWALNAENLARHLGISRVRLLNDVEAAAFSLPHLQAQDLATLNSGEANPHGTRALIAAGTGLGEAILFCDGERYHALPTEGGEADFSAASAREIELLQQLRKQRNRVSAEDVLSGSGFRLIHQFFDPNSSHASFEKNAFDSAQEITQNAASGACRICHDTLDFWIEAYGSEAGNLALRTLAFGGIYVAGGIAPKILPALKAGGFARAFSNKGRFAAILARIPIHVVLNENAPLLGAAYQALTLAQN